MHRLVDVRRFPGSRRHPWFGSDSLRLSLPDAGMAYRHAPELGGRRAPAADSPNGYWRNRGFRGYADYMAATSFREGLDRLLAEIEEGPTVVMCAEAVPWRCHRYLLSDAVVANGVPVEHILNPGGSQPHVLNEAALVSTDGVVTYPGADADQVALGL